MKLANLWEGEFEESFIFYDNAYNACQQTHAIILLTDWEE